MEALEIAARYGLPTVLLAVVVWGVWRSVQWAADNLAIPFRDASISLLNELRVNVTTISENLKEQTDAIRVVRDEVTKQTDYLHKFSVHGCANYTPGERGDNGTCDHPSGTRPEPRRPKRSDS